MSSRPQPVYSRPLPSKQKISLSRRFFFRGGGVCTQASRPKKEEEGWLHQMTFISLRRGSGWGGGYKCQLSVIISVICQFSVKFQAFCQLSVKVIPLFCTAHPLLRVTLRHPSLAAALPTSAKRTNKGRFCRAEAFIRNNKCRRSADSFLVCYRKTRKLKKCA